MNNTGKENRKITLLTASAGAGKTYSLAQNVISLLKEDPELKINEILLITFTNKAVEEMEKTVFGMVENQLRSVESTEKERWLTVYNDFNNNAIMTFDAFFALIVRHYGLFSGIDPQFTIINEMDRIRVSEESYQTVRENIERAVKEKSKWLDIESSQWLDTAHAFGGVPKFLDFVRSLSGKGEKADHFIHFVNRYFHKNKKELWDFFVQNVFVPWFKENIREDIALLQNIQPRIVEAAASLSAGKMQKTLNSIVEALAKNESVELILVDIFLNGFFRKPPEKTTERDLLDNIEQIITIRNNYYHPKETREFYQTILSTEPPEDWNYWIDNLKTTVETITFINELNALNKQTVSAYDFDDVRDFCRQLLTQNDSINNNILGDLVKKYKYVFIDEFQDTAPSQLDIIDKIFAFSEHPVFLVGDEKQSIYRFRGSEVGLTQLIKTRLKDLPEENYQLSNLQYNFRSFKDLVQYYNIVFGKIFASSYSQKEFYGQYTAQEFPEEIIANNVNKRFDPWENAKLTKRIPGIDEKIDAHLEFNNYSNSGRIPPAILSRVKLLLESAPAEHYFTSGPSHPFIGILLPTTKYFSELETLFDRHNIRYSMYSNGFYQAPEIVSIINLLRFWTNPYDLHTLSALLGSELIGLPEQEIRCFTRNNITGEDLLLSLEKFSPEIFNLIEKWRLWGAFYPLKEAVWKVIDYSPMKLKLNSDIHAPEKIANMAKFIRQLPEVPLSETVGILEKIKNETSYENEKIYSDQNVVVMTIHKSKGLKFQHVITVTPAPGDFIRRGNRWMRLGLGNQFDVTEHFYFTSPRFYSPGNYIEKAPNPLYTLVSLSDKEETTEEHKRLVYVAHTRAVQGLTIFNPLPSLTEQKTIVVRKSPVHLVLWEMFNRDGFAYESKQFENTDFVKTNNLDEEEIIISPLQTDIFKEDESTVSLPLLSQPDVVHLHFLASSLYDVLHKNSQELNIFTNIDTNFSAMDQSAAFGSDFHLFMENNVGSLIRGEMDKDLAPDRFRNHLETFINDLKRDFFDSVVYTETQLDYSYQFNLNGIDYEIRFEGIADLIIEHPQKGIFLFDYKTGKRDYQKHIFQMAVYRFLLERLYGMRLSGAGLIYSSPAEKNKGIEYINYNEYYISLDIPKIIESFIQSNNHF